MLPQPRFLAITIEHAGLIVFECLRYFFVPDFARWSDQPPVDISHRGEKPMMNRRNFLLSSAGLAAFAGLGLTAFRHPADAAEEKFPYTLTDAEWRKKLTPEQYDILRKDGTEPPFSSPLLKEHRAGIFHCAGCGQALYSSKTKFDSGTGWPSFYAALPGAVGHRVDTTLFMVRTEEHCANCGGHLGHVFDDGPPPTGKRHCIDGAALTFVPKAES